MKKEYLSPLSKALSKLSDTELVDLISDTDDSKQRETAKALLHKRLMIVLDDHKESTKLNSEITSKSNRTLVFLTWIIAALTVVLAFTTIYGIACQK